MRTIEVTNEIFDLLELYNDNKDKESSYSKTIKYWHDEVLNSRRCLFISKRKKHMTFINIRK